MAELSQTERSLLDEAVQEGKRLARPFLPREVFVRARQEGYALKPAFDPRFVRAGCDAQGRPLWTIDEDAERLQRYYLANFFCALSSYAERCYGEATSHAGQVLREAYSMHSGQRPLTKSREELVCEHLIQQGWTLGGE